MEQRIVDLEAGVGLGDQSGGRGAGASPKVSGRRAWHSKRLVGATVKSRRGPRVGGWLGWRMAPVPLRRGKGPANLWKKRTRRDRHRVGRLAAAGSRWKRPRLPP